MNFLFYLIHISIKLENKEVFMEGSVVLPPEGPPPPPHLLSLLPRNQCAPVPQ